MTGPPPTPPPKWKTAIVTLVAVFPPVLFFNIAVVPYLGGFPLVLRTLALCVGVTAAVTWVMMPRLMPLVKNWLNASRGGAKAAEWDPAEEMEAPSRGSSRSRGARQGWDAEGAARPAWLLDAAPAQRAPDPEPWYDAPRETAPRRSAPDRDDYAPPRQSGRRAPWYGRQPEDDYQTVELRPAEYDQYERYEQDERYEPDDYGPPARRRNDYREDDYYEEPARYRGYDEPEWAPTRDRGPGTGRYRR